MTPIFFDTFFNLEKYLEHEQRDPFVTKENDDVSIWPQKKKLVAVSCKTLKTIESDSLVDLVATTTGRID